MPAIYSRTMQYVCRGLHDHDLGFINRDGEEKIDVNRDCLGVGSLNSWFDDLTIATGGASKALGVQAHCEMLRRVFERLFAAGMTLTPSKSHLLRKELEVLGYIVMLDGIEANPEKVQALDQMPDCLQTKKQ
eukprot:3055921-Pleurochrysis_carterae.AAC.2